MHTFSTHLSSLAALIISINLPSLQSDVCSLLIHSPAANSLVLNLKLDNKLTNAMLQFIMSRALEIKVVGAKLIFFSFTVTIFSIEVLLGKVVMHASVCIFC